MGDIRVPDLNVIYIAGRLTRDPDLRYTQTGRAYCRLGIANTRYYRTKDGERREEATFVNASCWDKQAEFIGERLRKGRPVLIEGSLRSYDAEDQSGQKTTRIEINARRVTPLDWDEGGAGGGQGGQGGGQGSGYGGGPAAGAAGGGAAGGAYGGGGYGGSQGNQGGRPQPRPIEEPMPEAEDDIPF
jgi:single-strand DNA-binding protein